MNWVCRSLLGLGLCVAMSACGGTVHNYPYQEEPDPRKQEFVIGVEDVLSISVWKNSELNTQIQVRPDGTITMPLLGDVKAAGLTPTQLKGTIKTKMAEFIRDESAVVTVAVTEVNSYAITISGNVTRPGVLTSKRYLTIGEAVVLAGGPNRFASPEHVTIIRSDGSGKLRRIPVNFDDVASGKNMRQNVFLLSGDKIHVP